MSDQEVSANYAAFDAAAQNFAITYGRFEGVMEDLRKQVVALTTNSAIGTYAQNMLTTINNVNSQLADLKGVLNNIAVFVPQALQEYQSADSLAASLFTGD